MSYDEATVERVRQVLSERADVAEKRMVGGTSFSVSGGMCCGVAGTALMVRVGRDMRERALAEPHVRPMEFAGRRLSGFVLVDAEAIATDADLSAWVQRGIDFAASLPAKTRRGTAKARARE